jgi:predicted dehydrogenase
LSYPRSESTISRGPAPAVAPAPRATREESLRIGLIGPGGFASSVLVPAFVEAGVALETVGGGGGRSAEAAQRRFGFGRVAPDEEAVITDSGVDAVVVATRHGTHADLAARALAAGKHVFCEKPLALNEEELNRVLDEAWRSGRILLVGFNRRFSPFARELRAFIEGTPFVANYRVSAGNAPPSSWVHDLDDGGGRIIGEACHFLDTLVYLCGSLIVSVAASAIPDPKVPAQARDNVVVSVAFADGSVGTITYAAAGSPSIPKERLEVFAGSSTAILDDYNTLEFHHGGQTRREVSRDQDKGHADEVRAFVRATDTGESPIGLSEIENVSLAALAIVESLRTGATVRLGER